MLVLKDQERRCHLWTALEVNLERRLLRPQRRNGWVSNWEWVLSRFSLVSLKIVCLYFPIFERPLGANERRRIGDPVIKRDGVGGGRDIGAPLGNFHRHFGVLFLTLVLRRDPTITGQWIRVKCWARQMKRLTEQWTMITLSMLCCYQTLSRFLIQRLNNIPFKHCTAKF